MLPTMEQYVPACCAQHQISTTDNGEKRYLVIIFFEFDVRTQKRASFLREKTQVACLTADPDSMLPFLKKYTPKFPTHWILLHSAHSGNSFPSCLGQYNRKDVRGAEPTCSQQSAVITNTHFSLSPKSSPPRTREKCLVKLPLTKESSIKCATAVRIQFPDVTALGVFVLFRFVF